jgi:hypothetical protein
MTRMTLGVRLGGHADSGHSRRFVSLSALGLLCATIGTIGTMSGCAEETATGEQRVHIVKNADAPAEVGGIPPDKQADIQLMLQQREPSVRKCYNDVLNDGSHDRTFKGTLIVLISLSSGNKDSGARVTAVKIIGGSLNNDEVNSCLVEKLKEFEYPDISNPGTMQYTYKFEPAY